jgi:hypothetical protein
MTLVYSIILDMTLLYLIMFWIILFLVYFDYMLGIVRLELYSSIGSYSACSLDRWVSGKYCLGMVPIPYFPTIAPNIPDSVVDRGSDSPVESFVVHLPSIGQAKHNYYRGFYLCTLKKDATLLRTPQKLVVTYMPSLELFFSLMPFRRHSVRF